MDELKTSDNILQKIGEIYYKRFKRYIATNDTKMARKWMNKYEAICLARSVILDADYGQMLLEIELEAENSETEGQT